MVAEDEDDYDLEPSTPLEKKDTADDRTKQEGGSGACLLVARPSDGTEEVEKKLPHTYRDTNTGEDVLQFSVLFGPASRARIFKRSKAQHAIKRAQEASRRDVDGPQKGGSDDEDDEERILHEARGKPGVEIETASSSEDDAELEVDASRRISARPRRRRHAEERWMRHVGGPLLDGPKAQQSELAIALKEELASLDREDVIGKFSAVHQLPWEESILWDQLDGEEEQGPPTQASITLEGLPRQDMPDSHEDEVVALGRQTQLLRLENSPTLSKIEPNEFSFSCPNITLETGSWMGRIAWDDQHQSGPTPLLLDLNDKRMIFEAKPGTDVSSFVNCAAQVVPSLVSVQAKPSSHPPVQVIQACGDRALAIFNLTNESFDRVSGKKKADRVGGSFGVRHALPAATLTTMVPHLPPRLVLNFHRPRRLVMPAPLTDAQTQKNLSISFKLHQETVMWVQVRSLTGRVETAKIKNTATGNDLLAALVNKQKAKFDELKRQHVLLCLAGGSVLDPNTSLYSQGVKAQSTIWLVCTKVDPLCTRIMGALPTGDSPRRPPAAFQRKRELLAAEKGHIMLVEYLEEFPLLLSNNGMGARLTTFYQKTSTSDNGAVKLKEKGHTPLGPGHVVSLNPDDDQPFIGKLDPGQHILSLETNMYRSPLYPYKTPKSLFMLVRSSQGRWMLRHIDSTFLAGQEEPHLAVFAPGSQKEDVYGEKRIQVYCYRDFRRRMKSEPCPSVRIADMKKLFPKQSETLIRKRLKHCCDFQRGGDNVGLWSLKADFQIPDEETLRQLMPPEQVCCFESMRAGQERLVKANIKYLRHIDNRVKFALEQLSADPEVRKAAKALETELLMTPWNLSSSFVDTVRGGRGMLQLKGRGDPTSRGHGINFLKAPVKASDQPMPRRENTAGTDADLRRLNMEQAKTILLNFGVTEEEVAKLKRWERIACIREFSNAAAQDGGKLGERLNRFARGTRVSIAQQQEMYLKECNDAFERQQKVLSGEIIPGEATYDDAEDLGKDLEDLLEDEEEQEDNEADVREFQQMLRGEETTEQKEKKGSKEKWHNGKRRLRRTVISTFSDGTKHERVEIILDDGKISELKAMKASGGELKHTALLLSAEDEERLLEEKRAKRRLQEQRRRLRNKLARQEQEYNLLKSGQGVGTMPPPLPSGRRRRDSRREKKDLKMKCGACGQIGHMRTNVECPLYGQTIQKERERLAKEVKLKDIAVTHGFKLTLRSDQLDSAKDPSFKLKLPVMSSGTKSRSRRGTKRSTEDDLPMQGTGLWPEPVIKRPKLNRPPPPPEHPGRAALRELLLPIFESVYNLAKESTGDLFIKPVSKDIVPDYANFVPLEKKMDLTKVKNNITKLRYQRANDFRCHIQQIADNAHAYHDKGGKLAHLGIPPAADALVKRCDELLEQKKEVLADADSMAALPLQEALTKFGKAHPVQTLAPLESGSVAVCQALQPVLDSVMEHARMTTGDLFLNPVSDTLVPDYILFVHEDNKMDLSKMKGYVTQNMYGKSSEFFEHMRQIAVNAHTYHDNGGKLAHPSIPLAADRLVDHCAAELEKHKAAIERAETNSDTGAREALMTREEAGSHSVRPMAEQEEPIATQDGKQDSIDQRAHLEGNGNNMLEKDAEPDTDRADGMHVADEQDAFMSNKLTLQEKQEAEDDG